MSFNKRHLELDGGVGVAVVVIVEIGTNPRRVEIQFALFPLGVVVVVASLGLASSGG